MSGLKSSLVAAGIAILLATTPQSYAGGKRGGDYVEDYGPAWAGFYVGAHAGLAFGSVEGEITINGAPPPFPIPSSFEDDDTDFIGGLQVGYNWLTSGGTLFGVEADWTFLNGDVGTIRGRIGQGMGDKLLYATAGVAFSDGDDVDTTGFVAGAGVEFDLNRYWHNVTAGVEGLYYTFSDDFSCGPGCNVDVESDAFVVRGRINYHFGPDARALK